MACATRPTWYASGLRERRTDRCLLSALPSRSLASVRALPASSGRARTFRPRRRVTASCSRWSGRSIAAATWVSGSVPRLLPRPRQRPSDPIWPERYAVLRTLVADQGTKAPWHREQSPPRLPGVAHRRPLGRLARVFGRGWLRADSRGSCCRGTGASRAYQPLRRPISRREYSSRGRGETPGQR